MKIRINLSCFNSVAKAEHPIYHYLVQAGGGQYPTRPSPASNRAAAAFLGERANFSSTAQEWVLGRSVAGTMQSLTALQVLSAADVLHV